MQQEPVKNSVQWNQMRRVKNLFMLHHAFDRTTEVFITDTGMAKLLVYYNSIINTQAFFRRINDLYLYYTCFWFESALLHQLHSLIFCGSSLPA
jgi:hypothetical protein